MNIFEYLALFLLSVTRLILLGLPLRLRIGLLRSIVATVFFAKKSLRKVAHRNLTVAFPHLDGAGREQIIKAMFVSIARLISDFFSLPNIDRAWVEKHVSIPYWPRYLELKRADPKRGLLLVTGHLGSFELQGYIMGVLGHPISAVIRSFKLPRLNRWWNTIRSGSGNRVIDRKGAFRVTLSDLNSGRDVALLFDQNVTRNHAVFVDWFGKKAATSRAIALAALRTKTVVLVAALTAVDDENYRMNVTECNFDHIYCDAALSDTQKITAITQHLADAYCEMIRANPEAWFWMHRRWKTTESEAVHEDFYKT